MHAEIECECGGGNTPLAMDAALALALALVLVALAFSAFSDSTRASLLRRNSDCARCAASRCAASEPIEGAAPRRECTPRINTMRARDRLSVSASTGAGEDGDGETQEAPLWTRTS